ncbi:MAG: acyltransferase [Candidatus Omnitrophica bacterium]|nr:acyltransferase [Candidatus Omnitrophota bacterium]
MNAVGRKLGALRFVCRSFFLGHKLRPKGINFMAQGELHVNKGHFEMGSGNVFEKDFDMELNGIFKIGSRNFFNKHFKAVCFDLIEVGSDCTFADSVHIYDHDHGYGATGVLITQQGFVTKPVRIGSNVWLGDRVIILKGVTIGDGAIIGAGAVVSKDIPSMAIAAGVPARVIKMRK